LQEKIRIVFQAQKKNANRFLKAVGIFLFILVAEPSSFLKEAG
jgi:hypothetical protein